MSKQYFFFLTIFLFCSNTYGQENKIVLSINDTTQLTLFRAKFDTTGKHFEYYEDKFPYSINGRIFFGTDGEMPKYQLSKAVLRIGKSTYDLQTDNMYNPWFGDNINEKQFILKQNGGAFYFRGFFSDGAGSYGAEWLIEGKSSIRTILTNEEKILFEYFDKK